MKQQIKNGIIFGLTAGIIFTLFGVVYAAWNDTVSNGDTVSASSWNALVGKVGDMDNALSFSGSAIQAEELCDETGANCKDISAGWSASGGGSGGSQTSALASGWPDAIKCSDGVHDLFIPLNQKSATTTEYRFMNHNNLYHIIYTSTGNYQSSNNLGTYDCVTSAKSISTLVSEGNAFFFGNDIRTIASDADNDTKIMVEKNADEDKIRFDTAGSEKMIIDEVGNVGIGTTSPLSALHVTSGTIATSSSSYPAFYIKNDGKTDGILGKTWGILNYGGGLYFNGYGSDSSNLAPGAPVNPLFLQDQTGRVGIGTDTPTAKLSVNGSANKSGGGSWATFSDERLKDIQGDYTKGLSEILELHPVEFNYKEDNILGWDSEKVYQGLIAQEVQTTFPEAVTESSNTYLELDTLSIDMALINAIKELKAENDNFRKRIQILENN